EKCWRGDGDRHHVQRSVPEGAARAGDRGRRIWSSQRTQVARRGPDWPSPPDPLSRCGRRGGEECATCDRRGGAFFSPLPSRWGGGGGGGPSAAPARPDLRGGRGAARRRNGRAGGGSDWL